LPANYRGSTAQEVITILRVIDTTITVAAYGSGDGFTSPATEFGDDEEVRLGGTVQATNMGDLTGVQITVSINGTVVGSTPIYGFDGTVNYWQTSLGILSEGTYTVVVDFPRTRR